MARRRRKIPGDPKPCKNDKDKSSKCAFYKKCILGLLSGASMITEAAAKRAITKASRECKKRVSYKFGTLSRKRGAAA